MSGKHKRIDYALRQIRRELPSIGWIHLYNEHTDEELKEVVDCLFAHPDSVSTVWMGRTRLTDETGVRLAQYVAASTNITELDLSNTQISSATHLALAAALRVNTSLRELCLFGNNTSDHIDMAFVDALRINPNRPADSSWKLYSFNTDDDFPRLKKEAIELGHPTLQMLMWDKV